MHVKIFIIGFLVSTFFSCQNVKVAHETEVKSAEQFRFKEFPKDAKIIKSVDQGETWEDVGQGLSDRVAIVDLNSIGSRLFLFCSDGLYTNEADISGHNWQKELNLKKEVYKVYQGKNSNYFCSDIGGFYIKRSLDGLWKPAFPSLDEDFLYTMVERENGTLLLAGENGIFRSTDHGKTWSNVYNQSLVWTMSDGTKNVIAGSLNGLLLSKNDGATWELIPSDENSPFSTLKLNNILFAIFEGRNEMKDVPFVEKNTIVNRIRMSKDDGLTWEYFDKNLVGVDRIADIVSDSKYIYCSTNEGVFRSSNVGDSWELIMATTDKIGYRLTVSQDILYCIKGMNGC